MPLVFVYGTRSGPSLPVDCEALPAALIEIELFGHGRGSSVCILSDADLRLEDVLAKLRSRLTALHELYDHAIPQHNSASVFVDAMNAV